MNKRLTVQPEGYFQKKRLGGLKQYPWYVGVVW